jgi:hypothetical protein
VKDLDVNHNERSFGGAISNAIRDTRNYYEQRVQVLWLAKIAICC